MPSRGRHADPVVGGQLGRAGVALDEDERLGEPVALQGVLGVGHVADDRRPVLHREHDRGHVLPSDVPVDLARQADQPLGLAEEEPGDVEDVGADVGQDELLQLAQERLVGEDGEAAE